MSADARPAIDVAPGRMRAIPRMRGRTRSRWWPGGVLFAALAYGIGAVFVAGRSVPVFLSVDGAHAITDARGLIGLAPRAPLYLPAFPALLIPLDRLGVDIRWNVAAALALCSVLLFLAIHALARTSATGRGAAFGAIVGAASSALAELLAWQGGATLLALVATTSASAAFIRWERTDRLRDAALVGACLAIAIAAHPFMAAVGVASVAVQWAFVVLHRRRISVGGRGPTGVLGIAATAAGVAFAMGVLAGSYLAYDIPTGSSLRLPDPTAPLAVLDWLTRESFALAVLTFVFGAVAVVHRGPAQPAALVVVATFVGLPAFLAGDASYQTRVAYLTPPIVGVGAAIAWDRLESAWAANRPSLRGWRSLAYAAAPVAIAIWVGSLSLPLRLQAAVPYYSTLGADDYGLIEGLAGGSGTVAAGWIGNEYWDGMLNGWYAEGITNRPAIGPTDPALTTRTSERVASARAWQLFAGESGIENGSLQLAFGPASWRADPAIAGRIGGMYLPLVFLSDGSNDYGAAADGAAALSWHVSGSSAGAARRDASGATLFSVDAALSGASADITWSRGVSAAPWTIWIWPAYGLPWDDVSTTANSADVSPYSFQAYRDPVAFQAAGVRVHVAVGGGSTLSYLEEDPRYHVQAIAVHVPPGEGVRLAVTVSGVANASSASSFAERQLLRQDAITTVLVWRNSGWVDRFTSSPCFAVGASDKSVVALSVTPGCAAGPAAAGPGAP